MAPEHLLATFAKVCAEILAAASDGMLSLEDTTGQSVIQVAFTIPKFLYIQNISLIYVKFDLFYNDFFKLFYNDFKMTMHYY